MPNKISLTVILCLLITLAGCQQAQQTANDAEDLATPNSPLTNPTKAELEAVETPCDNAADQPEAEKCLRAEFARTETQLNDALKKISGNYQRFEEKARPQDKILAEKYKKSQENLQTAQKAWLAFRDADCAAEKEIAANDANSAFTDLSCRQRVTEDRIEELNLIYETR